MKISKLLAFKTLVLALIVWILNLLVSNWAIPQTGPKTDV